MMMWTTGPGSDSAESEPEIRIQNLKVMWRNRDADNDPKPNSDAEDPDQIRQNLNPDKDPKVIVSEFINFVGASSLKKPRRRRIVWIPELHKKFLYAVEKLDGAEKAVPKAILEAMDIPSLTRANVASHLQVERH
ncbi:hypothetical protein K1719_046904 [Acacia pycnantha]|nr:hypothetical protein K1719_046904 [Acacia pycnantha]